MAKRITKRITKSMKSMKRSKSIKSRSKKSRRSKRSRLYKGGIKGRTYDETYDEEDIRGGFKEGRDWGEDLMFRGGFKEGRHFEGDLMLLGEERFRGGFKGAPPSYVGSIEGKFTNSNGQQLFRNPVGGIA